VARSSLLPPGTDLYTATIINNAASTCRRQEFGVGVLYDTELDRAEKVAIQVARQTEGLLPEPELDVLVLEFAGSSINLKLRFYMDSRNVLAVGSSVQRALKQRFDAEGITIPYPITTVHLHSDAPSDADGKSAPADARFDLSNTG
jgi:small-conductance mechanosensitive channel